MDLSEKIYNMRKKSSISQKDLGKLTGVSNRAVSKWETGLSRPSTANLYKLSKIFNVPVEYFISDIAETAGKGENTNKKMKSLRDLYKIGRGPSSSHTMGPEKACILFSEKNPDADHFKIILYGSLAKTGSGHGTDKVIEKTLAPKRADIEFNYTQTNLPHPNTMDMYAFSGDKELDFIRVKSVGGGRIEIENLKTFDEPDVYTHTSFEEIAKYCEEKKITLWQYVFEVEGEDIADYLFKMWEAMKTSIQEGLSSEGILPGGLSVVKKAKNLYSQRHIDESSETRENRMVCSYAFAVSEQNACGEKIVTAPTCGASGVLPAVLYYQQIKRGFSDTEIIRALATAGIIGNLIKTNASISGAECGCQAEIGSACAMAAAALGELLGLDINQIEYAAEIAIEHHLGLTCDPICGLVQIPCIERNAVAAMRAINAVSLANFLSDTRKISLDKVINTMKETGLDLSKSYKETSEGGLAKNKVF